MKRGGLISGLGSVAFGVLVFAAFFVGDPPGGNYSANDVADFMTRGHRPAVFVSLYMVLLGVIGLICLLAHLRESVRSGPAARRLESMFWGSGLVGAACVAVGWAIAMTPPMAKAFGRSSALTFSPSVTYGIVVAGAIVIIGPGGFLLAVSMISFALGARDLIPNWLRWVTSIAAVIALASLAYFPFFILLIWTIVIGLWLIVTGGPQAAPVEGARA